jgi:S1-C subfamily serine protease
MEEKKGKIRPITWAILGIIVVFAVGYFGSQLYQEFQKQMLESEQKSKEQQDLLSKQQEELNKTKEEIEGLKNQKPQVIIKEIQPPAVEEQSLSSVISRWRLRVAYIECEFRYTNGVVYEKSFGSGLVYPDTDYLFKGTMKISTNKHVITDENGYSPYSCTAKIPEDKNTFTFYKSDSTIRISSKYDWGVLVINNPDEYLKSITALNSPYHFVGCATSKKPLLGDEVVILGYPAIGSQTDITATRGIISGYDGDYYITDAKIEAGNSGGAAILIKDDCYIGIPSFAIAGEIESLSRILDWQVGWK